MCYIVFDLEWNQAPCKEWEVKGIMFEILEIGAVKLDADFEIVNTFRSLIRPQIYKHLHNATKKLLHFDLKEMRKNERPFNEVASDFISWCGEDPVFCTWGPSDLTELRGNMAYYHMEPLEKGPMKYLDVQKLFSLECEDGKSRRSLEYAVGHFEIPESQQYHSALGDAMYTAEIFKHFAGSKVLEYHSYDTFFLPESKSEEVYHNFPTYSKYISRKFKNKNVAMSKKEVYTVLCNRCGEKASRVVKWFSPNGGRYYLAVSKCPQHGYLKAKARIKKTAGDMIYVVKTVKYITPEQVKVIKDKYDAAQKS